MRAKWYPKFAITSENYAASIVLEEYVPKMDLEVRNGALVAENELHSHSAKLEFF